MLVYNYGMGQRTEKTQLGFTILEVVLFLAVSSFLMIGLMIGAGSAIARQRYSDSVNDFAEFLRKTYADILTFENPRKNQIGSNDFCNISSPVPLKEGNVDFDLTPPTGGKPAINSRDGFPGRTNCAYYGKLITFGELSNKKLSDAEKSTIFTYDIIGKDYAEMRKRKEITAESDGASESKMENLAKHLGPEALTLLPDQKSPGSCEVIPAGLANRYIPQWQSRIERQNGGLFEGSILILRSPITGRLHTFYNKKKMKIQELLSDDALKKGDCKILSDKYKTDSSESVGLRVSFSGNSHGWKESEYWPDAGKNDDRISFCVGSSDVFASGGKRRNILINNISGNTSSVEIVPQNSKENKCE